LGRAFAARGIVLCALRLFGLGDQIYDRPADLCPGGCLRFCALGVLGKSFLTNKKANREAKWPRPELRRNYAPYTTFNSLNNKRYLRLQGREESRLIRESLASKIEREAVAGWRL